MNTALASNWFARLSNSSISSMAPGLAPFAADTSARVGQAPLAITLAQIIDTLGVAVPITKTTSPAPNSAG